MGRKRIDLGADADERIIALMVKGESAASIAAAFGGKASVPTIERRMRDLRGNAREARAQRHLAAGPAQESGDVSEVSEETPLEQLHQSFAVAKRNADKAEALGDMDTLGKMLRLQHMIQDLIRKQTPPPKADP